MADDVPFYAPRSCHPYAPARAWLFVKTIQSCLMAACIVLNACGTKSGSSAAGDALIVLPNATDIQRTSASVTYHISDPYPATDTIQSLRDGYAQKGCTPTDTDPMNPPPGFKYGEWDDYPTKGGESAKIWMGGWQCPYGLVVYTVNGNDAKTPTLGIAGAFYTPDQLKEIKRKTHSNR